MLIRMTALGTQVAAVLAAAGAAAGGVVAGDSGGATGIKPPTALVIDAAAARDGRELVDPGLRSVDAEVRLPRTSAEARTDVRYFTELGYRLVVAGASTEAAADAAGVTAVRAAGVSDAVAAVER
jgi:hypothetical protein